jgi:hypothetical protein
MDLERLIASLPSKNDAERRTIRSRAMVWADSGSNIEKNAARKVLGAFAKLAEREANADPVSKVERAFKTIEASESERVLIQVLLDNPGASSTKLTEAIGWQDKAWQLHFGKIGWDRQEYLWPAPWAEKRNAPFKAGILADYDNDTHGFTMKPDVVIGLSRVGIAATRP